MPFFIHVPTVGKITISYCFYHQKEQPRLHIQRITHYKKKNENKNMQAIKEEMKDHKIERKKNGCKNIIKSKKRNGIIPTSMVKHTNLTGFENKKENDSIADASKDYISNSKKNADIYCNSYSEYISVTNEVQKFPDHTDISAEIDGKRKQAEACTNTDLKKTNKENITSSLIQKGSQNIQNVQNMKYVQNVKDVQKVQHESDVQNVQNVQNEKDEKDVQKRKELCQGQKREKIEHKFKRIDQENKTDEIQIKKNELKEENICLKKSEIFQKNMKEENKIHPLLLLHQMNQEKIEELEENWDLEMKITLEKSSGEQLFTSSEENGYARRKHFSFSEMLAARETNDLLETEQKMENYEMKQKMENYEMKQKMENYEMKQKSEKKDKNEKSDDREDRKENEESGSKKPITAYVENNGNLDDFNKCEKGFTQDTNIMEYINVSDDDTAFYDDFINGDDIIWNGSDVDAGENWGVTEDMYQKSVSVYYTPLSNWHSTGRVTKEVQMKMTDKKQVQMWIKENENISLNDNEVLPNETKVYTYEHKSISGNIVDKEERKKVAYSEIGSKQQEQKMTANEEVTKVALTDVDVVNNKVDQKGVKEMKEVENAQEEETNSTEEVEKRKEREIEENEEDEENEEKEEDEENDIKNDIKNKKIKVKRMQTEKDEEEAEETKESDAEVEVEYEMKKIKAIENEEVEEIESIEKVERESEQQIVEVEEREDDGEIEEEEDVSLEEEGDIDDKDFNERQEGEQNKEMELEVEEEECEDEESDYEDEEKYVDNEDEKNGEYYENEEGIKKQKSVLKVEEEKKEESEEEESKEEETEKEGSVEEDIEEEEEEEEEKLEVKERKEEIETEEDNLERDEEDIEVEKSLKKANEAESEGDIESDENLEEDEEEKIERAEEVYVIDEDEGDEANCEQNDLFDKERYNKQKKAVHTKQEMPEESTSKEEEMKKWERDASIENLKTREKNRKQIKNRKINAYNNSVKGYEEGIANSEHEKNIEESLEDGTDSVGESEIKRTCEMCNQIFARKAALTRHVRCVHIDDKPFKCNQCGKCFNRTDYLKSHKKVHDKKDEVIRVFPCLVCDVVFNTAAELRNHKIKHAKCPYENCNFSASTYSQLKYHVKKHKENFYYTCPACESKFLMFKEFQKHKQMCYEVKYVCSLCNKVYLSLNVYTRHMRDTHLGNKKTYECKVDGCSKIFHSGFALREHIINAHHKVKRFFCAECNMTFGYRSSFTRHNVNMHKLIGKRTKVEEELKKPIEGNKKLKMQ